MSQAIEPKLLIDLTNARQATALNAESILHRMQIETFLSRVDEVVSRVEGFKSNLEQRDNVCMRSVSYDRYHDVITLHGKRGSGKTTFLLSALRLLQDSRARKVSFKNNWKYLDKLCVLEILDPTLFGLHEHLLLSLLAKIAFEVRTSVKNGLISSCDCQSAHCKLEKWEKKLRRFAKSLKHIGETRDDLEGTPPKETVPWEDAEFIFEQNIDNAQSSFGLEREFHGFLGDSLELLKKDAFVLALDDIDTRPQIGWHVLEVLRRYFTSPQLVVVLSGDMDLFKTIIEKQQLKIFDLNFDSKLRVRNEFKPKIDGLTEQYLLKILRTPSRINIGSFQSALHQWARIKPGVAQKIGKSGQCMQLDLLLERAFFPLFASCRLSEQRLFKQTLFANPARTVTQVLDALWEVSSSHFGHQSACDGYSSSSNEYLTPAACELAVERMREVFLVSLQNIGFGRPFELAEALQFSHGVNLLMKPLFERSYTNAGLDLLPTRQNPDENNALLALNAELTQAMRANPALLLGYALKACLLREVLLRKATEVDSEKYKKYEQYLGLEADELPSVTAARISALHWGEPKPNSPLYSMGMVRLYGSSITKNAPVAVRSMYGDDIVELQDGDMDCIPEELLVFFNETEKIDIIQNKSLRRLINTPETLYDSIFSWQSGLMGVGVIDVSARDNVYRTFSVFSLIAIICDFLEKDDRSIEVLLSQYNKIFSVNAFSSRDGSPLVEIDADSEKDDSQDEDLNGSAFVSRKLIKSLDLWSAACKNLFLRVSAPPVLCSNVMDRFFYAISRIDACFTNNTTFVGVYLHRCLIAFFNSVLVEEFLLTDNDLTNISVNLDNPITTDDVFIKNMFSTKAIIDLDGSGDAKKNAKAFLAEFKQYKVKNGSLSDAYPLFKAIFTFPLWGLYLKPSEEANASASSVYEIYIKSQQQDEKIVKSINSVTYGEKTSAPNFANMYHLLNSLAIPKSFKVKNKVVIETRNDAGKSLGLPLNPKSIKRKSIINSLEIKNRLLNTIEDSQGKVTDASFKAYVSLVKHLYKDESIITKLSDHHLAEEFWTYVKKNLTV